MNFMRRATSCLILCALSFCTAVLAQGTTALTPVPSEQLRGGALLAEEENFTATAPTGYQWMRAGLSPQLTMYVAVDRANGRTLMITYESNDKFAPTAEGIDRLLGNMAKGATGQGAAIHGISKSETNVPLPRSWKFQFPVEIRNVSGIWSGVVACRGGTYVIHEFSTQAQSPELQSLIASFQLLKKPAIVPPSFRVGANATPLFWLLLIPFAALLNRTRTAANGLNGATGAAILIALVAVFSCWFLGAVIDHAAEVDAQSQSFGEATGTAIVALAVALPLAFRFERRRTRERRRDVASTTNAPKRAVWPLILGASFSLLVAVITPAVALAESRSGLASTAVAQALFFAVGISLVLAAARKRGRWESWLERVNVSPDPA